MAFCCALLTVCFLLISTSRSEENSKPKIAIVGGGIGGTATAYFLSEIFAKECDIELYEYEHIGGRLKTTEIGGRTYEVGGTVLHPSNLYMSRFVDTLGLKKQTLGLGGGFAISNGKEILFKASSSYIWEIAQLLWRYGYSPVKVDNIVSGMLKHFTRIYECLDAGDAFTTVEELLYAMDHSLYESTKHSVKDEYSRLGVDDRYIQEMVQASIRVNYGQDVNVHSLVGSISMAGAEGGLWKVLGGNDQMPLKLLEFSQAVLVKEKVTVIQKLPSNQFKVYTSKEDAKIYDIVVIAAPFIQQSSNIILQGFSLPKNLDTKFHRTVATMVQGTPKMVEEEGVETMIITDASSNINSIGRNRPTDLKEETSSDSVYKVFSQNELSKSEIEAIFLNWTSVNTFDWLAYPHYSSEASLGSFVLSDRLFYVNEIESAASAMEMLAIAAKNVASLAYYDWTGEAIPQSCLRKMHTDEL